MDAAAEREVAIRLAVEPHDVAVGELRLVGVRRTEHDHHLVALVDRAAAELVSRAATRATPMTGVSHRSNSSTAAGIFVGSSTSWRR